MSEPKEPLKVDIKKEQETLTPEVSISEPKDPLEVDIKKDRETLATQVSTPIYDLKRDVKGYQTMYICLQPKEGSKESQNSCGFGAGHFEDLLKHFQIAHNWPPLKKFQDYCCGMLFASKAVVRLLQLSVQINH